MKKHDNRIKALVATMFLVFLCGLASAQISVSTTSTTQACNNDGTATITVTGGTAPYTFEWIDATGNTISTVQNPTNLHGGYYSIKVTDANSVIGYGYAYVQPTLDYWVGVITAPDCGQSNGEIMASVQGGSAPYTFMWGNGTVNVSSNNIDSLSNVAGGFMDLTVQDANGCVHMSDSVPYVYSNPSYSITATTTASDCDNGTASASIVPGGNEVAPVTYAWSYYDPNLGTNVNMTGANISNLAPGSHMVLATDAIGCEAIHYAYVAPGPNYLQTTANVTPALCPNSNGAIDLQILSGGTAPFTYAWNIGANTQDISGLSAGTYTVVITDAAGCVITRSKHVPGSSPVNASISQQAQPTCWNSDGELLANASGGTSPYTYQWTNGITSALNSNIPEGYYGVTVTDANGCSDYSYNHLQQPAGCWSYIQGTVFDDLNGNCVVDAGDSPIVGQIIDLGSNGYFANSSQTGAYNIKLVPGSYSVFHNAQTGYTLNCPTSPYSLTTVAGGVYPGIDFYDQPDSIYSDLQVYMTCGPARPGFNQSNYIYVKNNGSFAQSGSVEFIHDALLSYNYSLPSSSSYNSATNTVSINFNGLLPNQSKLYKVVCSVPSSAVINTPVPPTVLVDPITNDVFPTNNYDTVDLVVTGSYDPNIKEVNPVGQGPEGYITTDDETLEYTVHFQNTGNDTAFTVVIRDTLDNNLYIPSFKLIGASHNVYYTINGRALEFVFEDILLVDSLTNEPLSHGMVSFSIDQMPGLQPNDEIHNTAAIYFDYNLPIITNTTVNTITDALSVEDNEEFVYDMRVYPNPFKENVSIVYELESDDNVTIQVTDLLGKTVYNKSLGAQGSGIHTHNIQFNNNLDAGTYFVILYVNDMKVVRKLVH